MPVRAVSAGSDFIEINDGGRIIRVTETDVAPGAKDKMALAIQALLQFGLDTRIKIRDLPDDEPTKTVDPARSDFFWEGHDGNKELVARPVIVESVVWDGTRYVPTLTRAR